MAMSVGLRLPFLCVTARQKSFSVFPVAVDGCRLFDKSVQISFRNLYQTGMFSQWKWTHHATNRTHVSFTNILASCPNDSRLQLKSSSKSTNTTFNKPVLARLYSTQVSSESEDLLVYQGRVGRLFRTLKLFSLTTSAIGLCVQPYLWITHQDMPLAAAIPLFAAVNMFVFVNPFLIHYVAKKYVTELYFNPSTKVFTAVLLTFFAMREKLTFTADDVTVPDVPNMFAMLSVKGRPLFVHESDFTSLEVYKHLMRFDQPIDLTNVHPNREDEK